MALLVGISNGIIFSFYAEAPFLMIDGRGLSAGAYGTLCMVIVTSSIAAGAAIRRLSSMGWRTEQLLTLGLSLMAIAAAGLLVVSLMVAGAGIEANLMPFVALSAVLFAGFTLTTIACLHRALEHSHDALGTAGALFGLTCYMIVAALTGGMSILHNGMVVIFPAYALGLTVVAGAAFILLVKSRLSAAA
ncbi:hypothetical protein KXS07_37070 [Inquilinus limosus]|uniref:hypothetical protein n=1 Tax=Inquilinus limosus TaxID=171674 RepID=UPI003F1407C0